MGGTGLLYYQSLTYTVYFSLYNRRQTSYLPQSYNIRAFASDFHLLIYNNQIAIDVEGLIIQLGQLGLLLNV